MWTSNDFDGARKMMLELLGLSLRSFSGEAQLYEHLDRALAKEVTTHLQIDEVDSPSAHFVPDPAIRLDQGPAYRLNYLAPVEIHAIEGRATRATTDLRVSVIATLFNESRTAAPWVSSLMAQTLEPDEILIVDAGSTDGTQTILRDHLRMFGGRVELIEVPGASIAEGRNIALDRCTGDVVVMMDGGCSYSDHYIATLVAPHAKGKTAVSACGYRATSADATIQSELSPRFADFSDDEWSVWLPSTRCMAISGDLRIRFPEWLTLTGDDTLFDVWLRREVKDWYFTSEVLVAWQGPDHENGLNVLWSRYETGDGESGIRDPAFRHRVSTSHSAELGFQYGFDARPSIDVLRRGVRRVWVLCSLTPFGDSGGAQRTSQLAVALARQGDRVIFLSAEPSYEDPSVHVWVDADWDRITLALPEDPWILNHLVEYAELGAEIVVTLEAPHPLFEDLLRRSRQVGFPFSTHFSLIDDWNGRLGGGWFNSETQRSLILQADSISASAQALMGQLSITNLPRNYLPNAADRGLFHARSEVDPVQGRVVYAGSLWGTWLDWTGLFEAAERAPEMDFRLYGDLSIAQRALVNVRYPNLLLPGLVPQIELPMIYASAQVLLIPFLLNKITEGTNPLKVHEYIMMNRPVVTTRLPEYQALGDCQHLYFYEPQNGKSLVDAIVRAQHWDGTCNAETGGRHRGIFDWDDVAHEYVRVAANGLARGAQTNLAGPQSLGARSHA